MFSSGNAGAERLPGTVIPQHYSLALTPDLSKATFEGSETIDVTLAEPAEAITLNAVDIAFKTVTVTAAEKQQTARISLDKIMKRRRSPLPRRFLRERLGSRLSTRER